MLPVSGSTVMCPVPAKPVPTRLVRKFQVLPPRSIFSLKFSASITNKPFCSTKAPVPFTGVVVGGTFVAVRVLVGGTLVAVRVLVGGIEVAVRVLVGGTAVAVEVDAAAVEVVVAVAGTLVLVDVAVAGTGVAMAPPAPTLPPPKSSNKVAGALIIHRPM